MSPRPLLTKFVNPTESINGALIFSDAEVPPWPMYHFPPMETALRDLIESHWQRYFGIIIVAVFVYKRHDIEAQLRPTCFSGEFKVQPKTQKYLSHPLQHETPPKPNSSLRPGV